MAVEQVDREAVAEPVFCHDPECGSDVRVVVLCVRGAQNSHAWQGQVYCDECDMRGPKICGYSGGDDDRCQVKARSEAIIAWNRLSAHRTETLTRAQEGVDAWPTKWAGDLTVGNMIANLRTMPADMSIHAAYHIVREGRPSLLRIKHPTVSRERVDGLTIKTGDETVPYSAVIWSHPAYPPESLVASEARVAEMREGGTSVFRLEWIAAPRPPVHPDPMTGRQTFAGFEKAIAFMAKQAADAQFVSLIEIVSHTLDRTADALAALPPQEPNHG